jgi:hypothetical protein
MSDKAIIEAALSAWFDEYRTEEAEAMGGFMGVELNELRADMARVIAIVEAAALERAAKVVDDEDGIFSYAGEHRNMAMLQQQCRGLAAAIRALKEPRL